MPQFTKAFEAFVWASNATTKGQKCCLTLNLCSFNRRAAQSSLGPRDCPDCPISKPSERAFPFLQ